VAKHASHKLTAFKSWTEAIEALDAVFRRRLETDQSQVSERLEQIIFSQGLNDFRIRLTMTELEMARKKR